ncbi:hypothetical protein K8R47_03555 [archaeon]|nr:hypothetical protein [archaeon]
MDLAKSLFKVIFGLLLIVGGVYLISIWWPSVWTLIKGSVGIIIGLIGLLLLLLGFSDMKE